jgi:hypothetical protein
MVTAKTRATVHHGDRDLVRWLLPLFFDRVGMGPDAESRAQLMELFDTPLYGCARGVTAVRWG